MKTIIPGPKFKPKYQFSDFLILTVSLLAVIAMGCRSQKLNKQYSYKSFQGNIGTENSSVTMHLFKAQDSFFGYYYYNFLGLPFFVSGKLGQDNQLYLEEYDPYKKVNGSAVCEYNSQQGIISGTWHNNRIDKDLPIQLYALKKPEILDLQAEYFFQIDSINLQVSHIKIESVQIANAKKLSIKHKINQQIHRAILNPALYGNYSSIAKFLHSLNYNQRDYKLGIHIRCLVQINTPQMLGLRIIHTISDSRKAKPLNLSFLHNYSLKNGQEIQLTDIIYPDSLASLYRIALYKLKQVYSQNLASFTKENFQLNTNFAILPGGLLFFFNSQTMKSPSSMELFLPFQDINQLLNSTRLAQAIPLSSLNL